MGKALTLIVAATLMAGAFIFQQMSADSLATDAAQADRQAELLAREAARSGINYIMSRAKQELAANGDQNVSALVAKVNGGSGHSIDGELPNGSNYTAWIKQVSQEAYGAYAVGRYDSAEAFVTGIQEVASGIVDGDKLPGTDEEPSFIKARFIESMAGYCSAIYLQRLVPKGNNGHGNNEDGVDVSNGGGSKEGEDSDPGVDDETKYSNGRGKGNWIALEPEMLFDSGHYRNFEEPLHADTLAPQTRLNFLLAVDKDCDLEDRKDVMPDDPGFDYVREALLTGVAAGDDMLEGPYAMLQKHQIKQRTWRLAFEDLYFADAKLQDVKENSYGGSNPWDNKKKTYGGTGWSVIDEYGYYDLRDFGNKPDFSDQVIEIWFEDAEPGI